MKFPPFVDKLGAMLSRPIEVSCCPGLLLGRESMMQLHHAFAA